MIGEITARVWRDDAFKHKMLSDPRSTLAEMGVTFPANVKVRVHFDATDTVNIVIPANPAESELLDEVLDGVSGGGGSGDTCIQSTCYENC
jgi:hypothetical protein